MKILTTSWEKVDRWSFGFLRWWQCSVRTHKPSMDTGQWSGLSLQWVMRSILVRNSMAKWPHMGIHGLWVTTRGTLRNRTSRYAGVSSSICFLFYLFFIFNLLIFFFAARLCVQEQETQPRQSHRLLRHHSSTRSAGLETPQCLECQAWRVTNGMGWGRTEGVLFFKLCLFLTVSTTI